MEIQNSSQHNQQQLSIDQLETDQAFNMAFPHIFVTQSKQGQSPTPCLQYIQKFLVNRKTYKQRFFTKINGANSSDQQEDQQSGLEETNIIHELIDKINKNEVDYQPIYDYGSMIILQQTRKHYTPSVYISFPTQWRYHAKADKTKQTKIFADFTGNFDHLYVGKYESNFDTLEDIMKKITESLSKQKKNAVNNKNPANLAYILSKILQEMTNIFSIKKLDRQNYSEDKPASGFSLAWSFINFICENNNLTQCLMANYKADMLWRHINNFGQNLDNYKRRDFYTKFNQFQKCIQQVKGQCQKLLSQRNPYFNKDCAFQLILDIVKLLKQTYPQRQDYISSFEQMGKFIDPPTIDFTHFSHFRKSILSLGEKKQTLPDNLPIGIHITEIFEDLYAYSNLKRWKKYEWIKVFEDTVFTICANQLIQEVPFKLFSEKLLTQQDCLLFRCLQKYCNIIGQVEIQQFYFLKSQYNSHRQLMKASLGAMGFQIYKRVHQNNNGTNIQDFKIPFEVRTIYENFHSMNYKARRAAKSLIFYYLKHEQKVPLFDHKQGYASFSKYAQQVANQSQKIKKQFSEMESQQQQKISELQTKIKQHRQLTKQLQTKIKKLKDTTCQCPKPEKNKASTFSKFQQVKKCHRCIRLDTEENILFTHKQKRQKYIQFDFPQKDRQIHLFFQNLLEYTDCLELIKLLLYAQRSNQNGGYSYDLKMVIYKDDLLSFSRQGYSQKWFVYKDQTVQSVEDLKLYEGSDIRILYDGCQFKQINFKQLNDSQDLKNNYLDKFFHLNVMNKQSFEREHKIYPKIDKRIKQLNSEQFINIGSIRVSKFTQLIMTVQKLKKRSIKVNSSYQNKRYLNDIAILWKSIAQLTSQLDAYFYDNQKYQPSLNKSVLNQINSFFNDFHQSWSSQDFKIMPIVGPIASLLFMIVSYQDIMKLEPNYIIEFSGDYPKIQSNKFFHQLLQKIFIQFEGIEKDTKGLKNYNPKIINQNNLNQGYLCFGGLCYFVEPIITSTDPIAQGFLKLIILYRYKEVFFQIQSQLYNLMLQFKQVKQKAIDSNIEAVKKYFIANPSKLTELVRNIEQGITDDTIWKHCGLVNNKYAFKGQNMYCVYDLDIKTGTLLVNGSSVKRTPNNVKLNKYYKKIFGQRDFEVFPNSQGTAFRVNRNFDDTFSGNIQFKKDQAFFQFGYCRNLNLDQVTISIIFRYDMQQDEQKWQLIQDSASINTINIPYIFKNQYLPWICRKRQCIIFRKPTIQDICAIGLVVFYEQNETKQITKSYLIRKQYQKSSMNILCDPFSDLFDNVILRSDTDKDSVVYEILNKFDINKYIIEMEDPNEKIRKYWLHRYNLTCIQIQGKGLVFDIYKDYIISDKPYTNQFLPWSLQDEIDCIVLKKVRHNQLTQNLHQVKILMPFQKFYNKSLDNLQEIKDISKSQLSFLVYDLHDHFHRLSGINRISQLHLVAILIDLGSQIPIAGLSLTPNECAVKILYSCFNNTPLTEKQLDVIKFIQQKATGTNQTIILLCHAILLTTIQLISLHHQSLESSHIFKYRNIMNDCNYIDSINKCMSIYNWKIRDRIINVRNKIPDNLSAILGVHFNDQKCYSENSQDLWKKQLPLKLNLQHIDFFFLQIQNSLERVKTLKVKSISTFSNQVDKCNYEKQCPINMEQSQSRNKALVSEVIQELQYSYQSYLDDKFETDRIVVSDSLLGQFQKLLKHLQTRNQQIQTILRYTEKSNENHIDIVTRTRPILSRLDYVSVLAEQNLIFSYFPEISQDDASKLIMLIKYWMTLTVQIDSCKRIIIHLKQSKKIDKTIILRQVESPRQKIEKKVYWICFQVQMKIQIWLSQFQTFDHLMNSDNSKKGLVSQLNMGEGKTQVIIPMITLELLYGNSKYGKKIPRVNLLSSIFEESKINYFKFFSVSGFNIPVVQLPFTRQTNLQNQDVLHRIIRSLAYFRNKMVVLVDQSSVHSLILKLRQISIKTKGEIKGLKQQVIFQEFSCFDIFDQVDAQMTPKKSFIYSMGGSSTLDQLEFRSKLPGVIIDVICNLSQQFIEQNILTYDQTKSIVIQSIQRGEYPKGLRLISGVLQSQSKKKRIKQTIIDELISQNFLDQLQFINKIEKDQQNKIIQYLLYDSTSLSSYVSTHVSDGAKKILYNIRGLIAHGICQHCLSLRCRVNYGVPNQQRIITSGKRLAVPYEAADVPSKRNDFAQPDVAIFLSYLAYFDAGLSYQYFDEGMGKLFSITRGNIQALNQIYKTWYKSLSKQVQQELGVENASQIKLDSNSQMQKLYDAFKMNRKFIGFWLSNCVFQKDMKQYLQSITSSTWDHSDVPQSLGFSGTKDLHRLFPTYLSYQESVNDRIRGTDGKMLEMLLQNTVQIVEIQQAQKPLWQRIIEATLELSQKYNIGSIIDVGAALAGNSLAKQIVPWIASCQNFNKNHQYKGISFCQNNTWKVFQLSNNQEVDRGTTLLDHETFVIFDEYRTRGADMKMNHNITAALTLSPGLTKDSMMQAVGRLRKIGRDQKVLILMTQQVKQKIRKILSYEDQMSKNDKVKVILNWACMNSVKENQKFMLQNSKLAKTHFNNRKLLKTSYPQTEKTKTDLKSMYEQSVQYKSIHEISIKLFKQIQKQTGNYQQFNEILANTEKYGKDTFVRMQKYDEVLEREVQKIQQQQKKHEFSGETLVALPEQDDFKPWSIQISSLKYQFDKKLKYSKNFCQCTNQSTNTQINNQIYNQLQLSHFVLICPSFLCMITIRQAKYQIINKKTPFYNPNGQFEPNQCVALLSDLSIRDQLIIRFGFEHALVQCKLYNGYRNFEEEQMKYLKIMLLQDDIDEQKLTYFLKRRRLGLYYRNSSLQKAYRALSLLTQEQIKKQISGV